MIKCYWCKREMVVPVIEDEACLDDKWECPEGHVEVLFDVEGEIMEYKLFWDADERAEERYKLVGNNNGTRLLYSKSGPYNFRSYKEVFSTSALVSIPIRDNTLQLDNLVIRLQKMGAFA